MGTSLITALGLVSLSFTVGFTWWACSREPGVGQSPRSAILEAWLSIVIGFSINFAANWLFIPMAVDGGHMSAASNFWMGWMYTAISMVRQFTIRRFFNAKLHAVAQRIAGSAA